MSDPRQEALHFARAQIGKPYNLGSAGPDYFDCSGLTLRAWDAAGIAPELKHYTVYQYESTNHVPLSEAKPGDLLFFGGYDPHNGMPHHVGLYLDAGRMIDAPDYGIPLDIHEYAGYGDVMSVVARMPADDHVTVPNPVFKAPDRLVSGTGLTGGHQIVDSSHRHRFTLQSDGNLVLYSVAGGTWHAVWNSRTGGRGGTKFAVQSDGNLVLYNSKNRALWQSGTRHQGPAALMLRNDGDLVYYSAQGDVIWHSGTVGH